MVTDDPKYKHIAVLKLSSLGDIIHTLPAFAALRNVFPESKISWIVAPAGKELLKNFYGIDDIIVIDLRKQGLFRKLSEIYGFVRSYRNKFDLIIDFQGLIKSALLAKMLGGFRIGFARRNLRESQSGLFYNRQADQFNENQHVIFKNLHLLSALNIKTDKICYPLRTITPSPELLEFLARNRLNKGSFFIVNIGGGWETKLLTIPQYIDLINSLAPEKKNSSVILWGNKKEAVTAREISARTGVALSPFLSFSDLICFIRQASLIITADTLALHIADMVSTPSIGIFGPTSPARNGSLLKKSVAVFKDLPCNFCYKKKCDKMSCINDLNIALIANYINRENT